VRSDSRHRQVVTTGVEPPTTLEYHQWVCSQIGGRPASDKALWIKIANCGALMPIYLVVRVPSFQKRKYDFALVILNTAAAQCSKRRCSRLAKPKSDGKLRRTWHFAHRIEPTEYSSPGLLNGPDSILALAEDHYPQLRDPLAQLIGNRKNLARGLLPIN
jgi:hypothetical protein